MGANFLGKADFRFAKFKKKADFILDTFKKKADFSYTVFIGKVDFQYTKFIEKTKFERTTFTEHTSFKEVKILKKASLNFDHITTHDYIEIMPSVLNGEIIITNLILESDKHSLVLDLKSLSSPLALYPLFELFHSSSTHLTCFLYF